MKKFIVTFVILSAGFYYAWSFIGTRPGEQKVKFEPAEKECFEEAGEGSHYCIYKAKQGTNGGLVYHLHGRNLDENGWNDDNFFTALVQKYWASGDRKPPVVVSVSYGPIWLLTPKGLGKKSGLLETFISQTIPKIETRLGFVPSYRALTGESMGGLNSLIAGLRHPEVFQRVAALCPPVYRISPFDPWATIWNEIKVTGAEPKTIAGIILLALDYIQNVAEWNAINPLELIKSFEGKASAAFYLSAPLYDKYGVFEGNNELVETAKKRGINLKWHPLYGGHCAVDINSFADFLL